MHSNAGLMAMCAIFIVVISSVCAWFGVSTSWNEINAQPGDHLESQAIRRYYGSTRGLDFLEREPFFHHMGNGTYIDVTDPLYAEWAVAGKPMLAQVVLETQRSSLGAGIDADDSFAPLKFGLSVVEMYAAFISFQVSGFFYIVSVLMWIPTIILITGVIIVLRGGGG